jgi:hypothetical protein
MKKTDSTEKFEKQDFDLFEALTALDKKDYGYYDRLTEEQKRKFVPYMLIQWMATVKGSKELQSYYIQSTDYHANKYMFNELVQKNPKLQWLMLCAASPGVGKQFHQWIPNISQGVAKFKAPAKLKDIKEYYTKIYPNVDSSTIKEISEAYVTEHKKKTYLSERFPNLKLSDIETLSQVVTDEDITQYEKDRGN